MSEGQGRVHVPFASAIVDSFVSIVYRIPSYRISDLEIREILQPMNEALIVPLSCPVAMGQERASPCVGVRETLHEKEKPGIRDEGETANDPSHSAMAARLLFAADAVIPLSPLTQLRSLMLYV